ncbi:MAG: restriction endonuclease [Geobacter sp.]|nr:MAG: restriction endonuclease [Geobacter sp.]
MDITFHYPPELFNLLVDTIPLLNRSKMDVLLYFKGAGVNESYFRDLSQRVAHDKENINKYEIVRTILERLNQKGEVSLRERREVLKRIVEFDNFSACWDSDRLKAKGLVAEIRDIVNIKDSFTRMKDERETEAKKRREEQQVKLEKASKIKEEITSVKSSFYQLFSESNPYKRGKNLEPMLNELFKVYGISVRESFTLRGDEAEGIVEQIDGVVELDGNIYLVEMKWWDSPIGVPEISQHLVRIYHRGHARGIYISSSGYTEPAIKTCKEALTKTTIVLCQLQEIVFLLDKEEDLKELLRKKVQAAIADKNPFYKIN